MIYAGIITRRVLSIALKGYSLILHEKLLPEITTTRYGGFVVRRSPNRLIPVGNLFNIYDRGNRLILAIAIGDAEGHGIMAGIVMMMIVKEESRREPTSPGLFSSVTFII